MLRLNEWDNGGDDLDFNDDDFEAGNGSDRTSFGSEDAFEIGVITNALPFLEMGEGSENKGSESGEELEVRVVNGIEGRPLVDPPALSLIPPVPHLEWIPELQERMEEMMNLPPLANMPELIPLEILFGSDPFPAALGPSPEVRQIGPPPPSELVVQDETMRGDLAVHRHSSPSDGDQQDRKRNRRMVEFADPTRTRVILIPMDDSDSEESESSQYSSDSEDHAQQRGENFHGRPQVGPERPQIDAPPSLYREADVMPEEEPLRGNQSEEAAQPTQEEWEADDGWSPWRDSVEYRLNVVWDSAQRIEVTLGEMVTGRENLVTEVSTQVSTQMQPLLTQLFTGQENLAMEVYTQVMAEVQPPVAQPVPNRESLVTEVATLVLAHVEPFLAQAKSERAGLAAEVTGQVISPVQTFVRQAPSSNQKYPQR